MNKFSIIFSSMLLGLASSPIPARAQDADIVSSPAFLNGYQAFYNSFDWEHAPQNLSFKGLQIGAPVDLNDNHLLAIRRKNITSMGIDVGQNFNTIAPFDCPVGVVLDCELRLWRDKQYSPAANALQTAFGEQVHVHMWIIAQSGNFLSVPGGANLGIGRIAMIEILKDQPGDDFLQAAYQHFSEAMGNSPAVSVTGGGSHPGYSEVCKSQIRIFAAKPAASWTHSESDVINRCNLQLILANDPATIGSKLLRWQDAAGKTVTEMTTRGIRKLPCYRSGL